MVRVCSFFPTATEILYALGAGRSLVGRSQHCHYPPAVKSKPIVVTSRVKKIAAQDSVAIHQAVQRLRRENAHQFSIDVKQLQRLKPELVITQELCSVCAASHSEVSAAIQHLWPAPKVISLQGRRLDGIFSDIRRLGGTIDREETADRLIRQLQGRIEQVRTQVDHSSSFRPRVWVCEWLEPPMAAGHWIPELVELAGGTDRLGRKGADSAWLTWDQIRSYDPEVILVMPCSYSIAQTLKERWRLTRRPGWKRLSAVKQSQVFAVEGGLYHHAGPRLVDGLELFAHLFHPDRIPAGKYHRYFRSLI